MAVTQADLDNSTLKIVDLTAVEIEDALLKIHAVESTAVEIDETVEGLLEVVKGVTNITSLLTLDITKIKSVNVKGYYTANDGGGGIFNYDSTIDKSTANAGTIIDPDETLETQGDGVGTGCWVRPLSSIINIKEFGAKADFEATDILDGSTWTGTDNYTPFLKAKDFLGSIGGGRLFFEGRYFLSSALNINQDNIILDGNNVGFLYGLGTANYLVKVTDATKVTLKDFSSFIPRNNYRENNFMNVYCANSSNLLVDNIKTDGGVAGIWFYTCHEVLVQNCTIETPKADGIHFSHGSYNCKAISNTVNNAGDDALAVTRNDGYPEVNNFHFIDNTVNKTMWGCGVAVYDACDVIIANNILKDIALAGVGLRKEIYDYPKRINISNNIIKGAAQVEKMPSSYWNGTLEADDLAVTELYMKGAAQLSGTDISFIGNNISNIISVNSLDRYGTTIGTCENLTVSDNKYSNISSHSIYQIYRVGYIASNLSILDNTIASSPSTAAIRLPNLIQNSLTVRGNIQKKTTMDAGATDFILLNNTGEISSTIEDNISHSNMYVKRYDTNSLEIIRNNYPLEPLHEYIPVVTASVGAISGYTINEAFYTFTDKTIDVHLNVTIDDIGTAGGVLLISLPPITGIKSNIVGGQRSDGLSLTSRVASGNFEVVLYTGSFPVDINGQNVLLGGSLLSE